MKPTESGSIGEHLAIARVIEVLSSRLEDSHLEIFRVDRGTDLGIDFIIRISPSKENIPSIQIAVQVKATSGGRLRNFKPSEAHKRLIESFPGPAILLGYKYRGTDKKTEAIFLQNYAEALRQKNKTIDIEKEDKGFIWPRHEKAIFHFVRDLCANYVYSKDIEEYLSENKPEDAERVSEPLREIKERF